MSALVRIPALNDLAKLQPELHQQQNDSARRPVAYARVSSLNIFPHLKEGICRGRETLSS